MKEIVIEGKIHIDIRGNLIYFNDFDMTPVKRFYKITFPDINILRGWRAHKIEQRWFYCTSGEFVIKVVEIDNWDEPSRNQKPTFYHLVAEHPQLLHVPVGHATLIEARIAGSEVLAFGDYPIEHSVSDDYTYSKDYFNN